MHIVWIVALLAQYYSDSPTRDASSFARASSYLAQLAYLAERVSKEKDPKSNVRHTRTHNGSTHKYAKHGSGAR